MHESVISRPADHIVIYPGTPLSIDGDGLGVGSVSNEVLT
jgi:hypothetical protein